MISYLRLQELYQLESYYSFNRNLKQKFTPPTPIKVTIKNKFLTITAIIIYWLHIPIGISKYIEMECGLLLYSLVFYY